MVALPITTPLFVYWDHTACDARLVTSLDIEKFMRGLAVLVMGFDMTSQKDVDSVKSWSAHSLRVGAACVLHAMGFSPLDIQWLLRWRSLAFMAYLRNLAILSNRQHEALDKALRMPHLF